MTATRVDVIPLSKFVHETVLADVPADVIHTARRLLLDTVGALLGGLQYPPVQALAREMRSAGPDGPPEAPFGRLVALGTAATWLDADSGGSFHPQGHRLPPVPTAHPAPHSLPVLLCAAATSPLPDARILEVFLLANEVGTRFGVATSLRHGLHPHGIHGPVAAAVAASLLSKQQPQMTAEAMLIAASLPLAATLAVPMHGGTVRNLWTGLGAYYGAAAAGWAADGASSATTVVGDLLNSAVCTNLTATELTGGLGSRWRLADSYLKPYACARWIHPALDAWRAATQADAAAVRARGGVKEILVDTFAFAASLNDVDVISDLHARFSLPMCLATLAVDGALDAVSFLPENLSRREIHNLARRVRIRELPEYSAALPVDRPTRVTARFRDGSTLVGEVRNARGNPDNGLSDDEIKDKFRRSAAGVIQEATAEAVVSHLLHPGAAATGSLSRVAEEVGEHFGL